jgi:hypothetical protein
MGRHADRRKNSVLADGPLMRKRKGKVEKRRKQPVQIFSEPVQIFFYGEKEDFIRPVLSQEKETKQNAIFVLQIGKTKENN